MLIGMFQVYRQWDGLAAAMRMTRIPMLVGLQGSPEVRKHSLLRCDKISNKNVNKPIRRLLRKSSVAT